MTEVEQTQDEYQVGGVAFTAYVAGQEFATACREAAVGTGIDPLLVAQEAFEIAAAVNRRALRQVVHEVARQCDAHWARVTEEAVEAAVRTTAAKLWQTFGEQGRLPK